MNYLSQDLEYSIHKGLKYLLSSQTEDGSWTDWDINGDQSTPWTTAYIAYQLRFLPHHIRKKIVPNLSKAAYWLEKHKRDGGGWSYSDNWDSDADSTAFAILYLRSLNWPVKQSTYKFLSSFQRKDGGFTTFLPIGNPNSINISHVDVTASALFAMCTSTTPDWE